jgi:hypothetical protein
MQNHSRISDVVTLSEAKGLCSGISAEILRCAQNDNLMKF